MSKKLLICLLTIASILLTSCVGNGLLSESRVTNSAHTSEISGNSDVSYAISDTTSNNDNSATSNVSEESNTTPNPISETDVPIIYLTVEDERDVNRDFYTPATIKVVDPENKFEEIYDELGEIRIRGNSTSSGAKKPYNIKFSSKQSLLGVGEAKKWVLLANMYDKTLLRNKLCFDFAESIGMDYVSGSTFVNVVYNGRYIGNYLLTEAIDTGKTRVDINIDDNEFIFEYEPWEYYSNIEWIRTSIYNILFGFNAPEHPTKSQREFLGKFLYDAEAAILSKELEEVEKYFDLDSMVDFYIVNELFKNVDFSTSSTRFYIEDGKIHGGPVWDMDLSTGNCDLDYYKYYNNIPGSGDSTEGLYCQSLWYKYLFRCTGFEELVKQRYAELQPEIINLTSDNSLGINRIDYLTFTYEKTIKLNMTVWSISSKDSIFEMVPFSTYELNVDYLREWLIKRNEWLLNEWNLK